MWVLHKQHKLFVLDEKYKKIKESIYKKYGAGINRELFESMQLATYTTAVKNARLDAVRDLIDAQSGPPVLEIGTTAMGTVLATIELAQPSAPNASGGVLTFTMPQSDPSADATGTAAEARIRDAAATDIITGLTVGTSGTEIILDSVSITAGQTVTINSATITHAA